MDRGVGWGWGCVDPKWTKLLSTASVAYLTEPPPLQSPQQSGQGSCYLFRIDRYEIVDATMKGNVARFVNHCCDPCCYARIITVDSAREDGRSEKKIVFLAKRDIQVGEELTYDYHYAIEDEKIPCFCGAKSCRGFMN